MKLKFHHMYWLLPIFMGMAMLYTGCVPNKTKSDTTTEVVESKSMSDYEGCVVESISQTVMQLTIHFTDSSSITVKGIKYPLTIFKD